MLNYTRVIGFIDLFYKYNTIGFTNLTHIKRGETMNNLIIDRNSMSDKDILITTGSIEFNAYDKLKQQALDIRDKLSSIEVTEDNIKLSKRAIAQLNKDVKSIEDRRIAIKKRILEPYNVFEGQVKEIIGIVKDADNVVREQIRELEEIERDNKKAVIQSMYDNRIVHYSFSELVSFDRFFNEKMLNKTYSLNNIENELNTWLLGVDRDINVIKTFNEDKDDLLNEYLKTFNLAVSIEIVNNRKQEKERLQKHLETTVEEIEVIKEDSKKVFIYFIEDEKDAKIVELLMKENNIKYKKEIR